MSRIIRSSNAIEKQNSVQIELRDLFTKQFDADENEESSEVQFSLNEIHNERNRILEEANIEIELKRQEFEQYRQKQLEEIEQLKQQWEQEKLVLQKEAYEEGFQQGYEEGMNKALADMENSFKLANETIENARLNAMKYLEEQEHVILELAIKSAERIIGAQLEENKSMFLSIVKRGLKEALESKEVKLYVSPSYYKLVTENRDELAVMFPPDVPFLIFVNDDLNDTNSYIETNYGRIVLAVDEQLKELRLKLSEILESKD